MAINISNIKVNESFGQLLHISNGPEAAEKTVYSGTGVATAFKLGTLSATLANINFTGNTISAVTGDLTLGADIAFANAGNARTALGLSAVATSGAYSDLSSTPALAPVATSGAYSDLSGTPALAPVATSGAYSDLSGTPALAPVATSGAYSDLSSTPALGTLSSQDADNVAITGGTVKLDRLGYTSASYDTVTQITSKSTSVTLNSVTGRITMHDAQLNNNSNVNFTFNNTQIGVNDLLLVNVAGGGTPGVYVASVCCISAESAVIKLQNISGGSLSEPVEILFAVVKIG